MCWLVRLPLSLNILRNRLNDVRSTRNQFGIKGVMVVELARIISEKKTKGDNGICVWVNPLMKKFNPIRKSTSGPKWREDQRMKETKKWSLWTPFPHLRFGFSLWFIIRVTFNFLPKSPQPTYITLSVAARVNSFNWTTYNAVSVEWLASQVLSKVMRVWSKLLSYKQKEIKNMKICNFQA